MIITPATLPHTFAHTFQELFRQGDQERELGQSISPLMDRSKTGITKSQVHRGTFKRLT